MEIKTVTYQRVLNLGNNESKRLEMTAQLDSDEDFDAATSVLMQTVERKIREEAHKSAEAELKQIKQQIQEAKLAYEKVKAASFQALVPQQESATSILLSVDSEEPDPDIPFESGDTSNSSGDIPDGF